MRRDVLLEGSPQEVYLRQALQRDDIGPVVSAPSLLSEVASAPVAAAAPRAGALSALHARYAALYSRASGAQGVPRWLREAKLGADSVVKTTVYLMDMAEFPRMNAVYGRYFGKEPPARSTVQVAGLPRGVKVEIDVIAAF